MIRPIGYISGGLQFGLRYTLVQFKHLQAKLWEIKFSAPGGGFRVAYITTRNSRMIWLHAFKKSSQKTLKRDLDLAMKRMKEVIKNEKI